MVPKVCWADTRDGGAYVWDVRRDTRGLHLQVWESEAWEKLEG